MAWQNIKSKRIYTEITTEGLSDSRLRWGDVYAVSATSGRRVIVRKDRLREVETPAEAQEVASLQVALEQFKQIEARKELAWRASRDLSFNLGTAVTNIILFGLGGDLHVAIAALRDETVRLTTGEPTPEGEA